MTCIYMENLYEAKAKKSYAVLGMSLKKGSNSLKLETLANKTSDLVTENRI